MDQEKRYWCHACCKECKVIKTISDGEEVLLCSNCKNDFVEEMENTETTTNNNTNTSPTTNTNSNSNSNQTINQSSTNNTQTPNLNSILVDNNSINIELNINGLNLNNRTNRNSNNLNNSNNNNRQQQQPDQYGLDNTLLFLPSTVNYEVFNPRNTGLNLINSVGGMISSFLGPTINTIFPSLTSNNSNNQLMNFLNNHTNDFQFENLLNIIMSFEDRMHGNPPASERAMNNLKKVIINEENLNQFKDITCNICLDAFKIGNVVRILECKHEFHESCIITWLKTRNTCPVCRFELESNDPNYERQKNNHRENLRSYQRGDSLNNNNNNNNRGGGTFA